MSRRKESASHWGHQEPDLLMQGASLGVICHMGSVISPGLRSAGQVLRSPGPHRGPDCALRSQNQSTGQLQPQRNEGWRSRERLVQPSSAGHTAWTQGCALLQQSAHPTGTSAVGHSTLFLEPRAYSRTGADPHPGSRTWPGRRCGALDSEGLGVLPESLSLSAVLQAGRPPAPATLHHLPPPALTPVPPPPTLRS